MAVLYAIRRFFAFVLSFFLLIGVSSNGSPYSPDDENNLKLNFVVASDVHMEGNNKFSRNVFANSLYDMNENTSKNDVLVFIGDNTMNGQHIEYLFFYGLISKISKAENILVTLGNHDLSNGNFQYDKKSKRYISYYNSFLKNDISSPCYTQEINGYKFIFLASSTDDTPEGSFNDRTLDWLDKELSTATKNGKPVFVFNHQNITGEMAIRNGDKAEKIMTKYNNVYYFSGHSHNPLTESSFQTLGNNVHSINLPSFVHEVDGDNDGNADPLGIGVQIEVYDNKVVVKPRSYNNSQWLNKYNKSYEII